MPMPVHRLDTDSTYLRGNLMVTGPNYGDGSGWSLCEHLDGRCCRCVAEFDRPGDALAALRTLRPGFKTIVIA